jgi:hypothetical protein
LSPSLISKVLHPLISTLGGEFALFSSFIDLGALAVFVYYVRYWIKAEPGFLEVKGAG